MSQPFEPFAEVRAWVAIQRNPKSGSGRGSRELLELIRGLKRKGLRPRLFSKRGELDGAIRDPVRRAALRGIVAAGGDGTLLDVINRFPGIPVAVLPLGTENLFARAIEVSRSGAALADLIAGGTTARFDCARANGRRFLVVASAGFDAEVIRLAHARRSGRISRWFYAVPIASALLHYSFPVISVQLDDEPAPHQGCLVLVANLSRYALGLPLAPQARGDDALLDVCIFQCPGRWRLFRDLLAVLQGRHQRLRHVTIRRARRVVIFGETAVPLQIDGDAAGHSPVTIEVEPAAIEVFVPTALTQCRLHH